MDKPKCKLCGTKHSFSEPHKFADEGVALTQEPVFLPPVAEKKTGDKSDTLRKRKWRAKNKNKYNAYMKDFMRKDRAAKKG